MERLTVMEKVYSEIQDVLSNTSGIDSEDVYKRGDDVDEERPRVVYDVFENAQDYNDGSNGVYAYVLNDQDEVIGEVHRKYIEARFDIQILDDDRVEAEGIYSSLRDRFERYEQRILEPSSLHSEVNDIDVDVDNGELLTGIEPTNDVVLLPVNVEYYRKVTRDGEPIRKVFHDIEGINLTTDTSN